MTIEAPRVELNVYACKRPLSEILNGNKDDLTFTAVERYSGRKFCGVITADSPERLGQLIYDSGKHETDMTTYFPQLGRTFVNDKRATRSSLIPIAVEHQSTFMVACLGNGKA